MVISSAAVYLLGHDQNQRLLWHKKNFGQTHELTRQHDQLECPAHIRVAAFKCSTCIWLTASTWGFNWLKWFFGLFMNCFYFKKNLCSAANIRSVGNKMKPSGRKKKSLNGSAIKSTSTGGSRYDEHIFQILSLNSTNKSHKSSLSPASVTQPTGLFLSTWIR